MFSFLPKLLAFVKTNLYVGVTAVLIITGYVAWQNHRLATETHDELVRLRAQYDAFSGVVQDYFKSRSAWVNRRDSTAPVAPAMPEMIDAVRTSERLEAIK